MPRSSFNSVFAVALIAFTQALSCSHPAQAIPIFAERYGLKCTDCHSVLPILNAFGEAFRERGYRLPGLPKHGTVPLALRYQLEYDRDPSDSTRRFNPAGVLLSNADIGDFSYFVHYNLGAGGGPSGLFLGYLSNYNEHTSQLFRAGLFELPLPHSPGQRLDDLSAYGYETLHVGLNDLTLAAPRWGMEIERNVGRARLFAEASVGSFQGSAYGGAPVNTGEQTLSAVPEVGAFLRAPVGPVRVYIESIFGQRQIAQTGRTPFYDSYNRLGAAAQAQFGPVELLTQQWYGRDTNADGLGGALGSSGGFARLLIWPTPHAYLGVRYDTQAAPVASRDYVFYTGAQILPFARALIEVKRPLGGGQTTMEGALTIGFPGAWKW